MSQPIKWNQDVINLFSENYFGQLITKAHLSEEIVIEDKPLWLMNKNRRKYLIEHKVEQLLPIIPREIEQVQYNKKLYHFIRKADPAKFKAEKKFEFREFVNEFMDVKHSNPGDFLLYKFIVLAAYFERINYRVATEASFGKGVPITILQHLRKDTCIFNPASMAAVEYRLLNKLLVLDEISNLESSQKKLIQEFLLLAGDYKNIYEKSTRGSSKYNTFDTYRIGKLSLGIIYNILDHYESQGQGSSYFDRVFQKAVMDRFIPIKLGGRIDVTQFITFLDKNELASKYESYYIDIIRTIEYYKLNYLKELKDRGILKDGKFLWNIPTTGILSGRQKVSFDRIARFMALYSKNEKEFNTLCSSLLSKVRDYHIMISGAGMKTLVSEGIKAEEVKEPSIVEEKIWEGNEKSDKVPTEKELTDLFAAHIDIEGKGISAEILENKYTERVMDELKKGEIFMQSPGYYKRLV